LGPSVCTGGSTGLSLGDWGTAVVWPGLAKEKIPKKGGNGGCDEGKLEKTDLEKNVRS